MNKKGLENGFAIVIIILAVGFGFYLGTRLMTPLTDEALDQKENLINCLYKCDITNDLNCISLTRESGKFTAIDPDCIEECQRSGK